MQRNHSITFYIICSVQFFWALSFYSLWAVLPVFLNTELKIDEKNAFAIFGAFTAMGAAMLFIGGWLADKVIGAKLTLIWGYFFQGLSYAVIAWAAFTGTFSLIFIGLGLNIVGRGTGAVSPATIIAAAYPQGGARLDSAYTLLYMVNNVGAFVAQLVAPMLASTLGWYSAFLLSMVAMVANVIILLFTHGKVVNACEPDRQPLSIQKNLLYLIGAITTVACASYLLDNLPAARVVLVTAALVILYLLLKVMKKEDRVSQAKMVVGLVLMLQAFLFFILYNQMPTSLNYFAINNVQSTLFGISVNPVSYQSLNPMWIILFSPLLAYMYERLGKQGRDFSIPAKFAMGMLVCALAFACAGSSKFFGNEQGIVTPFWIFAPHLLFALGELLISALGLSVVAKLFPVKTRGFTFGAWNMTLALASLASAWVAGFSSSEESGGSPMDSLIHYGNYFYVLAAITALVAVLCFAFMPKLNRLMATPTSPTEQT